MSDTSIFVGSLHDVAWVRIDGVATKDTCSGIRGYFSRSLSEGLRSFVIDLEDCKLIDSTFIGILTGLAGKVVDDEGEVKVIHPNERNEKSICKLGLDQIIHIDRDGTESEDLEIEIEGCLECLSAEGDLNKLEKTDMILKAHEDLCAANECNREEFGDVIGFLKEDLAEQKKNR